MRGLATFLAGVLIASAAFAEAARPPDYCTPAGGGVPPIFADIALDAKPVATLQRGANVEIAGRYVSTVGDVWLRVETPSKGWIPYEALICRTAPDLARAMIGHVAEVAVAALEARDLAQLAALVDQETGVWFSPSAFLDLDVSVQIPRAELQTAARDGILRLWGYAPGSGDPIQMTFAQYLDAFVTDRDYAAATPAFNQLLGETNTRENVFDLFPNALIAELYRPAADEDGTEWSSLRLVFLPNGESAKLIGIVRAAWTP